MGEREARDGTEGGERWDRGRREMQEMGQREARDGIEAERERRDGTGEEEERWDRGRRETG